MRCFKRAGFVIATMILMFLTSYNGSVTYIPETIAAQSASQEAERIAKEAAEAAKRARQEAEAAREQKRKEDEAAAERARREAAAAAERKRKEDEAAAERARIEVEAAAERKRIEAEAAAERKRKEDETAAERARKEAEAAAERARVERIEREAAAERARKEAEAAAERLLKASFDTYNMVLVRGGEFTMGCTGWEKECDDDEKPAHQVTLSDFYIGKYELTQAQWQKVMGNNPSRFKGDNLPVENVSWNDVQEFIKRLNVLTGGNYRLPTEAEWEYAARGGRQSRGYKHSGSNNIRDVGWYEFNHIRGTNPVGTKKANELGIHDMSGNVSEWVHDYWGRGYNSRPQINPQGPSSGSYRVYRGGDWGDPARLTRVSYRSALEPGKRYDYVGFRLAHSPK